MPATHALRQSSQRNLLTNPGFEYKQRAAPFTTAGQMTLDSWLLGLNASTAAVTQVASTVGSGGLSLQMAYNHSGGVSGDISQKCENYLQLRGQQVTFAVTMKSTVNASARLYLADGVSAAVFSPYNVGTGAQRLTVTTTLASTATQLVAALRCDVASCTVEMNDATLCVGGLAMEYDPLHAAEDVARCLRYYQLIDAASVGQIILDDYSSAGGDTAMTTIFLVERMAVAPTFTRNGSWTTSNTSGQPTFTGASVDAVRMLISGAATGRMYAFSSTAGNTLAVEANI